MIRVREGWSIVLSGFWNRSIFLPGWVHPQLFPEGEIETGVGLLPSLPLIYRDKQVVMEISSERLVFRPLIVNDDAILLRAEAMAHAMLQRLPETPVHGVGVNFSFRETIPPGHVVAMFNEVEDAELGRQGWTITERKLTRRLTRGDDVLFLTMTYTGEAVDFEFNFHTEPTADRALIHTVEGGRLLVLRDSALAILRETYHLELGEDDADDRIPD